MSDVPRHNLTERLPIPGQLTLHSSSCVGEAGETALVEQWIHQQIETAHKLYERDPHEAFAVVEGVIQNSRVAGLSPGYARALRLRGMCYRAMGKGEEARIDFQVGLEQAQRLNDTILEAQCLHGLGNVHCDRAEFVLALEYIHRSIALRRSIPDEHGLMLGLNSLGAYLAQMGDFAHAVVPFTDSLQIARRLRDKMHEAVALSNIGLAMLDFGEYAQAIAYLTESLGLWRTMGSRFYEPIALEKLAHAHYRSGHLEEALEMAQQTVQVCQDMGNKPLEVNSLYMVALIQRDRGDLEIAERLFQQVLQQAKTISPTIRLADISCALGRLYLRKSDFNAARNSLELGLVYAHQTQQKQQLSELYLALSELYTATGDYQEAYKAHRAYHEMYHVQQKESAQNRLSAQLASLEAERTLQQAEIQRLRNIELVEANRQHAELLMHLEQQTRQLAEQAITDPLTGLYNRRYLQDYLQRELARRHAALSLAVADLDNFKQVNDRFSHLIGDEVLKATAQLIQNTVRHSDITVRYGGEEFVIVLPNLLRLEAVEVCDRVRRAIAAYNWASIHPDLKVTTSIGVADSTEAFSDTAYASAPETFLLGLADQRLYHAKENGKNRVL